MKGIDISRAFYEEYGKPMLENDFPNLLSKIAVGFVGSGSERYGFDDTFSRDHDFEAGFAIFLPDETVIDRRTEFLLERAYNKLPKEFMGVKREMLSPVGGNRNGPIRTARFYTEKVGSPDGALTDIDWLKLPDYALFEATNGEVFYDGYGEFTRIRESLSNQPEDIKLKKLAGSLLIMAQSGQYNYPRCVLRGEAEASVLALSEFVRSAVKVLFLLANRYEPYYKWSFHCLKTFEDGEITSKLSYLLLSGSENSEKKYEIIEEICTAVAQKLTDKH
ncbi:MAG: DUF4037 domain-containing protein, partial [Clostridiales bacterium]|nr:DUF4037 domain-containing protein [Candidatus Equinaster intestinalis]